MRAHAALLLATLLLAGCTAAPEEAAEDVQGNYEEGLGVALSLTNGANASALVTLRVEDSDGGLIGSDNATVEPGHTMVRRYAVADRLRVDAHLAYSVDFGGRAAGNQVTQTFDLLACDELTRASWRLLDVGESVGSQWLGTTCESASES